MKSNWFRLSLLSFALIVGMRGRTHATEFVEVAEDLTLEDAMDAYDAVLKQRQTDPSALAFQSTSVAEALEAVNGQSLLEAPWGTLTWNSELGNVEIRLESELKTLSYYIDDQGRPAFAGEDIQGAIDVTGAQVYLRVDIAGATTSWLGQIVTTMDESGQPLTSVYFANPIKCVCHGSNDLCDQMSDCPNRAPCTYRNNSGWHQSRCMYHYVPIQMIETAVPGEP